MSWLGRMFGRGAAAPPDSTPAVTVPGDVAAALTAGGVPLQEAVERVLRDHLAAAADPGPLDEGASGPPPSQIPFWLRRDGERSGDLEDALRDRIARRGAEGEGER